MATSDKNTTHEQISIDPLAQEECMRAYEVGHDGAGHVRVEGRAVRTDSLLSAISP